MLADTSKKIRAVKKANAEKGKYASKPPYGYCAKDGNTDIMLVDEYAAANVREIFKRIVAGDGAATIARDFTCRRILTPYAYRLHRNGADISDVESRWFGQSIANILRNPVYIGSLVSQRRTTTSYKSRKTFVRPEREWVVIENHHPAIVDKETFEIVQKLIERRRKPTRSGECGALNGLMVCADCGSTLRFYRCRGYEYYICALYAASLNRYSQTCTRHAIKRNTLEQIILTKIRETVAFVRENKETFAEQIRKLSDKESEKALKTKTDEIARYERRIAELDTIIRRIYEDNISGILSNERFSKFLADYEKEQTDAISALAVRKTEVTAIQAKKANAASFMSLVERHTEIAELTAEVARTFVSRIVVHEPKRPEGKPKKTLSQEVHIYFRHIGRYDIDIE